MNLITLPNGVRIVSDRMESVRSASLGIWVGAGSRCEKRGEGGSAHYIEHMLFKGTSRSSAAELAERMDALGGQCNAFTSRENTCYYARVLDSHLPRAVDILTEMLFDSRFDPADMDNERGVIGEEIDMYADTPEDVVIERLLSRCFSGALGRPVLGTHKSLAGIERAALTGFMHRCYRPDRLVISLAGSFTDADILRLTETFSAMEPQRGRVWERSCYRPCLTAQRKATEQNHFCLAWEGLANGDDDRFTWQLLSQILGEGLSSRLFQTVREKNGLCYSIGSFTASYDETGLFGISTAVSRETEQRALSLVSGELTRLLQDGVTDVELERTRELIKTNIFLAQESTVSRMNRLGSAILQLGCCRTPEEIAERYDAITREDVLRLARQIITADTFSLSAVGRVENAESYRELIKL